MSIRAIQGVEHISSHTWMYGCTAKHIQHSRIVLSYIWRWFRRLWWPLKMYVIVQLWDFYCSQFSHLLELMYVSAFGTEKTVNLFWWHLFGPYSHQTHLCRILFECSGIIRTTHTLNWSNIFYSNVEFRGKLAKHAEVAAGQLNNISMRIYNIWLMLTSILSLIQLFLHFGINRFFFSISIAYESFIHENHHHFIQIIFSYPPYHFQISLNKQTEKKTHSHRIYQ